MSTDDVEKSVSAMNQMITIAKDSPEGKEAAKNIGKTAVTLTTAVNNLLLPLAAFNYGIQRARDYFESGRFADDLDPLIKQIPEENLIEPKPSIAGPALQGLAFSHDEAVLKEMYLNLLANNMDNRHSDDTHPAFVEVIKQMTTPEAKLFSGLVKTQWRAIAEIRLNLDAAGGGRTLYRHLLPLVDEITGLGKTDSKAPSKVTNWIRLGLVEVDYGQYLTEPTAYNWVEQRQEYKELLANETNGNTLTYTKGTITLTPFGLNFAKSVGIT